SYYCLFEIVITVIFKKQQLYVAGAGIDIYLVATRYSILVLNFGYHDFPNTGTNQISRKKLFIENVPYFCFVDIIYPSLINYFQEEKSNDDEKFLHYQFSIDK
ncbi:hypothetical protein DERP_012875, partial [Dermatophagoides pteronyssinus]